MPDNLLRPPTPNMQGRELVQWLQRVYDVLLKYQTTPDPEPPEIPTSHNDLDDNGGENSHAMITSHLAASTAHNTVSPLVGLTDVQALSNKVINALNNTITNLRHGTEVDNPTAAHGVGEIVGTDEVQTLTNKIVNGFYNVVRNMRHGVEVDNASVGVHGVTGAVVGTFGLQMLFDKILISRAVSVSTDYTANLFNDTIVAEGENTTITLPAITADYRGKRLTIDNKSVGTVTVASQPDAADIEGETSQPMPINSSMTVCFDGSGWRIV